MFNSSYLSREIAVKCKYWHRLNYGGIHVNQSVTFRTSDVKQSNILTILRFIRNHSVVTKPQICKALKLSRPTVNNLVDELVNIGLLQSAGLGSSSSSGGKRPTLIKLNEQAGLILGVTLGRKTTSVTLTDISARPLYKKEFPTNHLEGPEVWFNKFYEIYQSILADTQHKSPIIGVGIAVRGLIDTQSGVLTYTAHMPEWTNVPLVERLTSMLGIPVYAEVEASAFAVTEKLFGSCIDSENFVTLLCGEGVGAGIFIDGSLYRGANNAAGEIGHTVVDENGSPCYCGNQGCLETIVSSTAVENFVRKSLSEGKTSALASMVDDLNKLKVQHVRLAIQNGDPFSIKLAETIGIPLGKIVATIVNMYNPGKIILCGEVSMLGKPLLTTVQNQVSKHALPFAVQNTEIILSKLDSQTLSVVGSSLMINQLFSHQMHTEQLFQQLRNFPH